MDVGRITSQKLLGLLDPSSSEKPGVFRPEGSFAKEIGEALSTVNQEIVQAESAARELAAGKGDLVETMISLGRADVSLRMVVNLRNRMLEAYQEIMRLDI